MNLTQTDQCNDVLAAPPGVSIDACRAAAIWRGTYADGQPVVITWWKPSAAELQALNAGEPVRLELWGVTMPPAAIGVGPLPLV